MYKNISLFFETLPSTLSLYNIYIYEQGPPHPPLPPARWFPPPPCGRGGWVFSAAKPIVVHIVHIVHIVHMYR